MRQVNFAKYIKVDPRSKKQSAQLTSSNSLVGNIFSLKVDSKKGVVRIYNKFNYCVAEIQNDDAKDIIL